MTTTLVMTMVVLASCGVTAQPALEISSRSANETFVGIFDYAIEVHCVIYNSGDKRGQAKVLGTLIQEGQTFEKRTSGGVASGDEREFTFTFDEAELSFDKVQYNCQLE